MPTLLQARQVFSVVKSALSLGADNNNIRNLAPTAFTPRIEFIKLFWETVTYFFALGDERNASKEKPPNYPHYKLMHAFNIKYKSHPPIEENNEVPERILMSLLAKTIKAGRCGEQASIGFAEFLKAEFNGCIELIKVISKVSNTSHELIVLNRTADMDIEHPELWPKKVIVFDTWAEQLKEISAPGDISKTWLSTLADLPGENSDITIKIIAYLDREFTPELYQMIIDYLKATKELMKISGEELCQIVARKSDWKDIDIALELKSFHNLLDQEIQHYSKMANPSTRHAEEKAVTQVTDSSIKSSAEPIGAITRKSISKFAGLAGFYNKPLKTSDEKSDETIQIKFTEVKKCLGAFMEKNADKVKLKKIDKRADVEISGIYGQLAINTLQERLKGFDFDYKEHNKGYTGLVVRDICRPSPAATVTTTIVQVRPQAVASPFAGGLR